MTDKIVNLFTGQSTGAPVPEVIAVLEDLLAQAKAGDVQSLAFASQCADGAMQTGFTSCQDVFSLVGAVNLVATRLLGTIE